MFIKYRSTLSSCSKAAGEREAEVSAMCLYVRLVEIEEGRLFTGTIPTLVRFFGWESSCSHRGDQDGEDGELHFDLVGIDMKKGV